MANVDDCIRRLDQLKSDAANKRNVWQDVARNFMPSKAYITETVTPGTKHQYERLYDITPMQALGTFAAGVHGYLTNPATQWFRLRSADRGLRDIKAVQMYFHEVVEIMQDVLHKSNFDAMAHEVYTDSGGFGTAVMSIESDPLDGVRYETLNLSECYFDEGPDGRVNTLYREFEYTVEQAYIKFGEDIGPKTMDKLRDKRFTDKVRILHAIYPREVYEFNKKDAQNMPFASKWVNIDEKHEIKEGGFKEFPLAVPRTNKRSGIVWGDSLCERILPAARGLQKIKKTVLRSAMKRTDPPLAMPKRSAVLPLNLNPSALNFTKRGYNGDDIKPLSVQGDTGIGIDMIAAEQQSIKDALFNDLFIALGEISKQMTVPEVNQRIFEKMILLGPIIGSLMKEFLDVTISRTYRILADTGMLPDPPDELEGEIDIEYVSPLATSQRMATKTSIEMALNSVAQLGQIDPSVYYRINFDETAQWVLNISGTPPELIRDDNEVQAMKDEAAAKQRTAEMAELVEKGVDIARNASEVDKNMQQAGI